MKKKYIYLIVAGLALGSVATWYGMSEFERKPENAGDRASDFTLTADQLQKEFEANEEAATKKYTDKALEITGTISGIATNEKSTDISLKTPDDMTSITIQVLPQEKTKAAKYEEGDQIRLKGICTGKLMDIELNKGVILQ